jgi:hypothetical protein
MPPVEQREGQIMSHLRRLCALVAVGTLTFAGLTVTGGPAQAATADPRPVTIGADWLAGELTGGFLPGDFGPLYGPSLDAGLSLKTVGGHATAVASIRSALSTAIGDGDYITGEAFGDTGSTYAGAVAKSLVFVQESGGGATSFGGVNLVTRLEAQVSTTAPNAGRISDTSTFGDFANTLGQAFAARGLSAASSSKAADAVSFLLEQQCSAGYFRADFAPAAATDQSCDAGIATDDSSPSIDATAIAVQQLQAIASPSAAVTNAIGDATSWLLTQQHADGSFSSDDQLGINSDSTGLAGIVLHGAGATTAAARAATWVRSHQADDPSACPSSLSGETGAIAYDDDALAAGRSGGIGGGQQWRVATAQALPVLQWAPAAASPFDLGGPTGYVQAGTSVGFQVTGAAPGTPVCVSGVGAPHLTVAPASGGFSVSVAIPAGTADHVVTASVRKGDSASFQVRALGAASLRVRPAHDTVHRGARLRVVVRGLAPGESVALRVHGVTVRSGNADLDGRFVKRVRPGRELGKVRIVARGEFPTIRHGRAVVRVVR